MSNTRFNKEAKNTGKEEINNKLLEPGLFTKISRTIKRVFYDLSDEEDNTESKYMCDNFYLGRKPAIMTPQDISQIIDVPLLNDFNSSNIDLPSGPGRRVIKNDEISEKKSYNGRKFSLDSKLSKKKIHPVIKVVSYITNSKFNKNSEQSSQILRNSAFKIIDNSKSINLGTKTIINYMDFYTRNLDKLPKPIPIKPNEKLITKKRPRTKSDNADLSTNKKRRLESEDVASRYSNISNLNKLRNTFQEDVSMKSVNASITNLERIRKNDLDSNISMNSDNKKSKLFSRVNEERIVSNEEMRSVKTYNSKTVEDIRKEIEAKRYMNKKMFDEFSKKSERTNVGNNLMENDKRNIVNDYYKEKEKRNEFLNIKRTIEDLEEKKEIFIADKKEKDFSFHKPFTITIGSSPRSVKAEVVKNFSFEISKPADADRDSLTTKKEKPKEETNSTLLIGDNNSNKILFGFNVNKEKEVSESQSEKKAPALFSFGVKDNKEDEKKEEKKDLLGASLATDNVLFGFKKPDNENKEPNKLFTLTTTEIKPVFGFTAPKADTTTMKEPEKSIIIFGAAKPESTETKPKEEIKFTKEPEKLETLFNTGKLKEEGEKNVSVFSGKLNTNPNPIESKPTNALFNAKGLFGTANSTPFFTSTSTETKKEEKPLETKSLPTTSSFLLKSENSTSLKPSGSIFSSMEVGKNETSKIQANSFGSSLGVNTNLESNVNSSSFFNSTKSYESDKSPIATAKSAFPVTGSLFTQPIESIAKESVKSTDQSETNKIKPDTSSSSLYKSDNPFLKSSTTANNNLFASQSKATTGNILQFKNIDSIIPETNSLNKNSINFSNRSKDIFAGASNSVSPTSNLTTPFNDTKTGQGLSFGNISNANLFSSAKISPSVASSTVPQTASVDDMAMAISPPYSPKTMPKSDVVEPSNTFILNTNAYSQPTTTFNSIPNSNSFNPLASSNTFSTQISFTNPPATNPASLIFNTGGALFGNQSNQSANLFNAKPANTFQATGNAPAMTNMINPSNKFSMGKK